MKRSIRAASNAIDYAKFYSLWHVTAIETRAFPSLARRHPRDFTFYVADPAAPFAFTIWLAMSSQVASWIK
jgi:hypothetical protein